MEKLKLVNGVFVKTNEDLTNDSSDKVQDKEDSPSEALFASDASSSLSNTKLFTDRQIELSKKYNVPLAVKNDTQSLLEKSIGAQQSGWEQFGRSLGQILVNEVLIGTVLGLSDLVDSIINLGTEYGENDWTNPLSSLLTGWQDNIKDYWKIYRENPDKAFDLGDAGWWWDNFVTVGSTASLMIPSMGVAKGLGLIGKGAKLLTKGTKFDRVLYNSAHWMGKVSGVKNAEKLALNTEHAINNFFKAAVPAVASRQMEDMLEARETYKSTMDEALQEFNNMTPEQREAFYARNTSIIYDKDGKIKSDEEIAKYIADKAASYTFANDFKYIGFDFMQFNNLLRFGSKPLTRSLNATQRATLFKMATGTEQAADEILESAGRMGAFKDALKFYAKNPRIALKNLAETTEFTEGLEEIGQGITQTNAKNTYGRYFNPNYTDITIASQLADPHLWEQGFWGMVGGITFKGIGKGGKYLWKKGKLAINKNKYTDEDIHRLEATEESIRKEEVESRATSAQRLEAKLKLWAAGYNPQQTVYDAEGNEIKPDFSDESQFTKMAEDEKALVFDDIINEYLTTMVTNAVDVGNGELLEAFIKDENFKKYIDRISSDNTTANALYQKMLNRFSDIKTAYYGNLEKVFGSVNVESEYIGKALASFMTRNQMHIKDLQEQDAALTKRILGLTDEAHYDNYLTLRTIGEVNRLIGQAFDEKRKVQNDETSSRAQKRARIREIDRKILELQKIGDIGDAIKGYFDENKYNFLSDISDTMQQLSDDLIELSNDEIKRLQEEENNIGSAPDVAKDLINQQIKTRIYQALAASQQLLSQEDIQENYNDFIAAHEDIIDNRFKKARQRILDYITNAENPEQAYQDLLNDNGEENIQKDFDLFKIGNELYNSHKAMFEAAAKIEKKKDEASVEDNDTEDEPEIVIDDDEVTPTNNNPFTGEQQKTEESKEDSKEQDKEQNVDDNSEEIILQTEEDIAVQDAIALNPNLGTERMDDSIQLTIDLADIILTSLTSMSSEQKIALREKGVTSDAFKELRDKLINYCKSNDYAKTLSDEEISKLCESTIASTISNLSNSLDVETKKKYLSLVDSIRKLHKQAATTPDLAAETEKEIAKQVEEIIELYLKNNRYQKKGNRPIINIEQLFTELLGIYDRAALDLVNPILQYLRNDLRNGNKYYIEDYENISKYLNKPNQLIQYLKDAKVQKQILGDEESAAIYGIDYHAQMPLDAFKGFQILQRYSGGKYKKVDWENKGTQTVIYDGYKTVTINNIKDIEIAQINAYIDYQNAMYAYRNTPGARIIAFRFGTSIQYRVDDGHLSLEELKKEENGKSMTIGFMSTVTANSDNTSFSRDKAGGGKGLFFTVTKNTNGRITSNFDDSLIAILTQSNPNAKMIYEHLITNNENFTKEELKAIEEYFNLQNNDDIRLYNYDKTKELTVKGAQELLFGYIKNFLIDTPIRFNQSDFVNSYKEYVNKVYDNYAKTFEIQKAIGTATSDGNFLTIEAIDTTQEIVNSLKDNVVLNSKNVDTATQKIVFVDTDNQVHVSGSNEVYENPGLYASGAFGIMLTPDFNHTGTPAIAWIYSGNALQSNKKIKQLLHDTIYNLILKAYGEDGHSKNKNSFKSLFTALTDLSGQDSIFFGINAKAVCEELYKYNFADLFTEKEGSKTKPIDDAIDKLIEHVRFNLSFSLAKGKLAKRNKFVKIDSKGRITVSLTTRDGTVTKDTTLSYDSFTDYIVSTGNFEINQVLDTYNSLEDDGQNSLFFSAKTSVVSPVKGDERIGTFNTVRQYLEKSDINTPISAKELLVRAGIPKEKIDILFGETSGFTFIDEHIYYDKEPTDEELAYFDPVSKNIAITSNLMNNRSAGYRGKSYKEDLMRLLIHENVHKQFDSLSKEERKYLITELSKLFLEFADQLNKDFADTTPVTEENQKVRELAKKIVEGFANTRWSIDNINSIVNDIKEGKIDETTMNEFLAETLSQATLIDYLNRKEYTGVQYVIENKDNSNKTIWQRIVDLITQFFTNYCSKDLQNTKNNSIFANEYRLLSNIGGDKIINKNDSAAAEQQQDTKRKRKSRKKKEADDAQQTIDFTEETETEEETKTEDKTEPETERDFSEFDREKNEDFEDDDTDNDIIIPFAATPLIETVDETRIKINDKQGVCDVSGAVRVSDMIDFVQRFGRDKVANFSSMLNSGLFQYACK